jgi:hypothetical protein
MDWGSLPLQSMGAGTIVVLVVLMVLRGALVPRATLDDVRADRDARLEEKQREIDALRSTVDTLGATCDAQARHVSELLEVGRTAQHVLLSLPIAERGDG